MRGEISAADLSAGPLSPAALKVGRATRPSGSTGGLRSSPPAANEASTVAPKKPAGEHDGGVL